MIGLRFGLVCASERQPPAVQEMGVNHRRADVFVAEEFLHRADVVTVGQQVGCKRMAKRVANHPFGQSRLADSLRHRLLDQGFVNVVPSLFARLRIDPAILLRKYELPNAAEVAEWPLAAAWCCGPCLPSPPER